MLLFRQGPVALMRASGAAGLHGGEQEELDLGGGQAEAGMVHHSGAK